MKVCYKATPLSSYRSRGGTVLADVLQDGLGLLGLLHRHLLESVVRQGVLHQTQLLVVDFGQELED